MVVTQAGVMVRTAKKHGGVGEKKFLLFLFLLPAHPELLEYFHLWQYWVWWYWRPTAEWTVLAGSYPLGQGSRLSSSVWHLIGHVWYSVPSSESLAQDGYWQVVVSLLRNVGGWSIWHRRRSRGRTRGNRHRSQHEKLQWDIRKKIFTSKVVKDWKRLPGNTMRSYLWRY